MKNILILLGWREPYKRIALLYECMVSDGNKCTFFSLPRRHWNVSSLRGSEQELEKGFLSLKKKGTAMEKIPDIVVCCHWSLLPMSVILKVLLGSKLIYEEYDYHELMLKAQGTSFQKHITYFAVKLFKGLFIRFFDLVLCIHLKGNIHLNQLKKLNPNVLEIHNYASHKWARNPHAAPKSQTGVAFMYTGGVFKRKGCKVVAEAFLAACRNAESFDAELHIFSRYGDPSLISWLAQQPKVFVHEEMPPDRIRDFVSVRQCVGLLTYDNNEYYEHIGTNSQKVYEYLAAGIPVIASRLGELEPMIRSNDLGYLVDSDIKASALSKLFISVAEDHNELARKGSNASEFISRNQMWCEKEWEKILMTGLFSPV